MLLPLLRGDLLALNFLRGGSDSRGFRVNIHHTLLIRPLYIIIDFFHGVKVHSTIFNIFPVFYFNNISFVSLHKIRESDQLCGLASGNRESPAESFIHLGLVIIIVELLELGEMKVELIVDHVAVQNPDLSPGVDGNEKSLVEHMLVGLLNTSSRPDGQLLLTGMT